MAARRRRGHDAEAAGTPARCKNVLVSVLGVSPAVITETLEALCRRQPPFVPDRLVLFTTTTGAKRVTAGVRNQIAQLCDEFSVRPLKPDIRLLTGSDGRPLADIRNDADNIGAANVIINAIRELTADDNTRVHASLAGGRKTMGFYLSYAMSLFGRPQDELSHVLVWPPEVEGAVDFFFRPRRAVPLHRRNLASGALEPIMIEGRPLTSRAVEIELASVPFFRLRGHVQESVLNSTRPIDFADVVRGVNEALDPPALTLRNETAEVAIDGYPGINLEPTYYAFYRVLAEARAGLLPTVSGDGWVAHADFAFDGERRRALEAIVPKDGRGTAVAKAWELLQKQGRHGGFAPVATRYLQILSELGHNPDNERGKTLFEKQNDDAVGEYLRPIRNRLGLRLREITPVETLFRQYAVQSLRKPARYRFPLDPRKFRLE